MCSAVCVLILGYGQKGRKKRSAGSGGVIGGLVASMEKFLSCRTPETQIEGVDVWHLLHNHIDGRLLVCGSIYSFSCLLKRTTSILNALLPSPPFGLDISLCNLDRICRYMDNHSIQLLKFNGIM